MRRTMGLVLAVLAACLLTGCAGTPQSREAGRTAVVSVLGAEPAPEGLRIHAAAEGRGEEGPMRTDGVGATPAEAIEALSRRGADVVSCAHVEHLVLSWTAAERLPDLLSYAFQDPQQSTETMLWVLRAPSLEGLFDGTRDTAKEMALWKSIGEDRQGLVPVTLRDAASRLAEGGDVLIPALTLDGDDLSFAGPALYRDDLSFAGLALYRDGAFTTCLEGQEALGAALLLGQRIHWTASAGAEALSLQVSGCRVEPVWSRGALEGLSVRCRLEGVRTGGWESRDGTVERLETELSASMRAAVVALQRAGSDGAGLLGRAGLAAPLRWQGLSQQWAQAFPSCPVTVETDISVTERH